jgi:lactobin A/cerein 7B family class IIb bacteriocin
MNESMILPASVQLPSSLELLSDDELAMISGGLSPFLLGAAIVGGVAAFAVGGVAVGMAFYYITRE